MLVCILQNLIIFVSISLTVKIKILASNWGPQCEMTDSRLGDVLVSYWFFNKKETWHMRLISEVFLPARCTVLTAVMWVKETLVTSPHSPVVDSGERACWRWQGGSQWHHVLWHHILPTGLMPRMWKHWAMMAAVASQSSILHMLTFTTSPAERKTEKITFKLYVLENILFVYCSIRGVPAAAYISDSSPGLWKNLSLIRCFYFSSFVLAVFPFPTILYFYFT